MRRFRTGMPKPASPSSDQMTRARQLSRHDTKGDGAVGFYDRFGQYFDIRDKHVPRHDETVVPGVDG